MVPENQDLNNDSFAIFFRKFYVREKNRVVFCNGMSLNQLANAMWENLQCSNIDASILSKVVTGKRIFSLKQASCFSTVIGLSELDKTELLNQLQQSALQKLGFPSNRSKFESGISVESIYQTTNQLFLRGRCNEISVLSKELSLALNNTPLNTSLSINKLTTIFFLFGWAKNCLSTNRSQSTVIEQKILLSMASRFGYYPAQAHAALLRSLDTFAHAEYFSTSPEPYYRSTLDLSMLSLPFLSPQIALLALRNIVICAKKLNQTIPDDALKIIKKIQLPIYEHLIGWTLLASASDREQIKIPNIRLESTPTISPSSGIYYVSIQKDQLISHRQKTNSAEVLMAINLALSHEWIRQANKITLLSQNLR